ncbi:MAG TPA: hypothetical protein VLE96_02750 [Chlamydiales bacterium]|nr:hypothetical protein [Chlamydiales bacterium]
MSLISGIFGHNAPTQVQNEIVCSWRENNSWLRSGRDVQVIRSDNNLRSRVLNGTAVIDGYDNIPIPIPKGKPIEAAIEHLSRLQPEVTSKGVSFNATSSGAKLVSSTSRVCSDVRIDEDNWCVTLVDGGGRSSWNPLTWGGHAAIIIESIENGCHRLDKAHLVEAGKSGTAHVSFNTYKSLEDCLPENFPRGETFTRPKPVIKKMMDAIDEQKRCELDPSRRKYRFVAVLTHEDDVDFDRSKALNVRFNCIKWARYVLKLANINVAEKITAWSSETPRLYMGLGSRVKQEAVTATSCVGIFGTIFSSLALVGGIGAVGPAAAGLGLLKATAVVGAGGTALSVLGQVLNNEKNEQEALSRYSPLEWPF